LLCGQCFRYEEIENRDGYALYLVNAGGRLIFIGQKKRGELIFYGSDENELNTFLRNYFDLDTDYRKIGADIRQNFSSEFLDKAIDSASGIAILRQDPWETVCSFIISQNNNIPRIRKIIREISAAYGENLALKSGIKTCPIDIETTPCEEKCKKCGRCYTFPTAKDISENPELLLPSKPGFRYKYILDAANKINSGEIDLAKIKEANSYEVTVNELSKILGVGLKVASCAALFGFYNLDAFPIDVWMKRAIDRYFGGSLDHRSLGKYAGVAQQYIFHYIRNLNDTQNEDKK
jgi:N-glycosylase/DNA lyase